MNNTPEQLKQIAEFIASYATCLLGAGVHTSRVLRNSTRIGDAFGVSIHMTTLSKTLVITILDKGNDNSHTEVAQIPALPISFEYNAELSALSWEIYDRHLPLEEVQKRYEEILARPRMSPKLVLLLVGFANASFCRLFGGDWGAVAIVFVAKSLSAPGATLFCQSIGTRHYRRDTVFHDHIALETGLRPEDLRLTFALNGREVGPLAFTLPDASTAYHCYALNYDKGTLGLWVDGVPIGKLETPASEWPHDPSAPFLTDSHRLTLTAFRFGRHVADNNTVTFRPDYVIDDLAFYGRALSPKEIAAAAAAFTLTGKPPKANSGRVEPPAKQP